MLLTGAAEVDAERAFGRAARRRGRAALARRLRRRPAQTGRLAVYDDERLSSSGRGLLDHGLREIPIEEIRGTLEPSRAALFDAEFRPARSTRRRWQNLWMAEHRGAVLPPISVVPVGDGYAVRDGHHRVSVARARGAIAVDASVDPVDGRLSRFGG